MNQHEILKKIGGIIAELKEQHTYLELEGNEFNELELELFVANAHFLTDHIEILKKIYGQAKTTALPAAAALPTQKVNGQRQEIPDYFGEEENSVYTENAFSETIESSMDIKIADEELPKIIVAEEAKQEIFLLPETTVEDEVKDLDVEKDASFTIQKMVEAEKAVDEKFVPGETVVPKYEITPEATVQNEIYILPETLPEPVVFIEEKQPEPIKSEPTRPEVDSVLTLNERIAAQKNFDQTKITSTQPANKPVSDLQSLISLNDKLLFIKELFNGYNLAYSEAINILNRYSNFEQAEQFLNLNYTVKNNWKEKPLTAERFFDLLRKRFA